MKSLVGVIMGSTSDWETMKYACDILNELKIPYEKKVVSAHRTPDYMFEYAETARERGLKVIIAGAGGVCSFTRNGCDKDKSSCNWCACAIKSIEWLGFIIIYCSNARGVPVATVAIGKAGSTNAGLLAAQILGSFYDDIHDALELRREAIEKNVREGSELI
ncbi:5-(carboxyamino)imidazole ribonucleotide mutase [Bacillus cytotoxicus]